VEETRWQINSPSVASEILDGELIIMNQTSGKYFTSAGIGPAIWQCVEAGMPRPVILNLLAESCGMQEDLIAVDVDAFVGSLVSEGLIVEASASAGASPIEAPRIGHHSYAKPALSAYSDMQDLLLLDPIHDVSEEGWPVRSQSQ
jgi:hypothetical protein